METHSTLSLLISPKLAIVASSAGPAIENAPRDAFNALEFWVDHKQGIGVKRRCESCPG